MRTFISINPDKSTKDLILEVQNDLKQKLSAVNKDLLSTVKWEPKDKFHITLFFIGDTEERSVENIIQILNDKDNHSVTGKISLTADSISAFPKLKYSRVIFLSLLNEDGNLFRLSEFVNRSMGSLGINSDKTFHPHITLGRVRRDRKISLSGFDLNIKNVFSFDVKNFFLMESKLKSSGSEYSVVKEFNI